MGVTVEDCEAILAARKKGGGKIMIAYRLHHEPGTLDVIDRVRKGDFGDPRIFSSIFTQDLKPENHRAKQGNCFIENDIKDKIKIFASFINFVCI
jgi:predicted dehydrogenase